MFPDEMSQDHIINRRPV